MSIQPRIRQIADDEFFVAVPEGKEPTTIMVGTADLLRAGGEEVLATGSWKRGFWIKILMKEGTFSAIQGAATNALEGLTIGSG